MNLHHFFLPRGCNIHLQIARIGNPFGPSTHYWFRLASKGEYLSPWNSISIWYVKTTLCIISWPCGLIGRVEGFSGMCLTYPTYRLCWKVWWMTDRCEFFNRMLTELTLMMQYYWKQRYSVNTFMLSLLYYIDYTLATIQIGERYNQTNIVMIFVYAQRKKTATPVWNWGAW